jgi:hypothetical protein
MRQGQKRHRAPGVDLEGDYYHVKLIARMRQDGAIGPIGKV